MGGGMRTLTHMIDPAQNVPRCPCVASTSLYHPAAMLSCFCKFFFKGPEKERERKSEFFLHFSLLDLDPEI